MGSVCTSFSSVCECLNICIHVHEGGNVQNARVHDNNILNVTFSPKCAALTPGVTFGC